MTAKEKAKEIIKKLNNIPSEEPCFIMSVNQCKKAAIILCDEIIEELGLDVLPNACKYWIEVREEIKKIK